MHYPLLEQTLKRFSLVSALVLTAAPIVLLAPFYYKTLTADFRALQAMS